MEATEAGGIEHRKRKEERATGGKEPDFVGVPDRTDGRNYCAAFGIGVRHAQMQDANAEIETVQQNVDRKHQRHQAEPYRAHGANSAAPGPPCTAEGSGPWSISRETRNRKRMPSTVYIPAKPKNVNQTLPADTSGETPVAVRSRP